MHDPGSCQRLVCGRGCLWVLGGASERYIILLHLALFHLPCCRGCVERAQMIRWSCLIRVRAVVRVDGSETTQYETTQSQLIWWLIGYLGVSRVPSTCSKIYYSTKGSHV